MTANLNFKVSPHWVGENFKFGSSFLLYYGVNPCFRNNSCTLVISLSLAL